MSTQAAVIVRRPRNAEATRAAILQAARARFSQEGYEQVGVRDIAADAGIDPALVNRYFGSKEGLFNAVLGSITKDPLTLRPAASEFGDELARIILRLTGDRHKDQLTALDLAIRSTNSPTAHAIVRADLEERFIAPLVQKFGNGPDAAARAHICMAVVMGIGVIRGVLGDDAPSLQMREDMINHLSAILAQLADPANACRRA